MPSQSHQGLFLTIRNNELLTIQDFAHLRSALGPRIHSSHTRRVFLERKLIARYRRSVLARFFGEWKHEVVPPGLVSSSDDEPEQANSPDDESLESDDDVPNGWDLVYVPTRIPRSNSSHLSSRTDTCDTSCTSLRECIGVRLSLKM